MIINEAGAPYSFSAADSAVNGDQGAVSSPAKSSSSGDFDRSSKEVSFSSFLDGLLLI